MASASMAAPLAPLSPLSLSTQDVLPASSFGMILPSNFSIWEFRPKVTVPHLKPTEMHTGPDGAERQTQGERAL